MNKKIAKRFSIFMFSMFASGLGFNTYDALYNTNNIVEAKLTTQETAKSKQAYQQAIDCLNKGDVVNSAKLFMDASKIDEKNPLYSMFSGDMLKELKQYPSAIRYYNSSLENIGHASNKKQKGQIKLRDYIGLSKVYLSQKDKDNSLKYANKIIEDFPDDYRGNLTLANVYVQDESTYDLAITNYNTSLDKNEEQLDSYLALIKLYNKKNDFDNVISTYKKAIDYRPLDLDMKMSLSQVYISHKNPKTNANYYPEAIEVLKDYLNVNNKGDLAHYYLSILYILTSDDNKAEQQLSIVNQLNPNLGNKLSREIQAYRLKHAQDKAKNTAVTVDENTNQITITVENNKPPEDASAPPKNNEKDLVDKQVATMEKKTFKEDLTAKGNSHDSSSASSIQTVNTPTKH